MTLAPGDNFLNIALSAIDPQIPVFLRRWVAAAPAPGGAEDVEYDSGNQILASVQAVDTQTYEALGLDFAKRYIKVYSGATIRSLARDNFGDIVVYMGLKYRAQQDLDWSGQDGWTCVLCVQIPAERDTVSGVPYE